jgi:arsenate reductase
MATVLFVLAERGALADEPCAFRARSGRAAHGTIRRHHPGRSRPPEVVEVMAELGIDLAGRTPQLLTRELAEQADVVVTR